MNTTTQFSVDSEQIAFYRENGFVHIPNIISPDEAAHFRAAALETSERLKDQNYGGSIFNQNVNVWRDCEEMKSLTFHPNIAAAASQLAGVALRLWHDQILIKKPENSRATEFHQDQPYWPHAASPNPISCWIALQDVPVERGCMTFLPRSQHLTHLPAQNLTDHKSLFSICPELAWQERITVPLRAGDCTFHHGRCAHMATPNTTDATRVAHVVIFVDADTIYTGKEHIVTDDLGLQDGEGFKGELFPTVEEFAARRASTGTVLKSSHLTS